MDEIQWKRLMSFDETEINLIELLKRRQTFIKCKPNGRTYSRIYYLISSEDAIHYLGSKRKAKREACKIKDIDEVRRGFTPAVWEKCLRQKKINDKQKNLAFSILYDNRHSIYLLADSEEIRDQWIEGIQYLIERYRSHLRTHHEITDRWIWNLFTHADRDHSGKLHRGEVRRLLGFLNIELDGRDIDQYFNQANIRTNNYEELRNLDRDEFLIFYKFISYRPELIDLICKYNGNTPEQKAAFHASYNAINKLPITNPLEDPKKSSSLSIRRRKAPAIIAEINDKKNYLTTEQLKDFLQKEQHMESLSIEDSAKLIAKFEPSTEGKKFEQMGIDGFRLLLLHDEFCILNPNKSNRIYHDMTRPITDYFIATSHNTYLRDNQVYGDSTPETYIHALKTGCRAVELDCYDGDYHEPKVYHGNTLTKPITFREIIHAIEPHAFSISPYPLFLNLENHCSYTQQGIMARILKETFKDRLLTKPLVDNFEKLPSPEDLKYKVIIRSRRNPKGKIAADPKPNQNDDGTEPDPKEYHPDFSNLIIYSQTVSFTNILHTIATQKCFHSISFKESKLDDLIKANSPDHLDLIKLTKQHLIRVYPRGIRQDSSNLDPACYWVYGVQMVALNYQADDESMCLQHGFFSDNGGCGYLLKPPFLLPDDQSFDPKEKPHDKVKRLHIHVISAQNLPKGSNDIEHNDIVDPYVEISTFGIPCDRTEYRTPSVRNNGLNPVWDYKLSLDIHCPELCLIKFQVRDEDRYKPSTFLGQACLPLTAIQYGYRHIKLKAKNGDSIHGTLFVHIKIDD